MGTLTNLSGRAQVLTGDNIAISGFIINGSGNKQVLIRGIGPTLAAYGLAALSDPKLTLLNSSGAEILSNNNWRDSQEPQIQATGLPPPNDLEPAIFATLSPGSYTAKLEGNNGATGIGLVEVYDIQGSPQLANLSTRAYVGTGDNVLIAGLIATSYTGGPQVLIRVLGPTLSQFGLSGVLQNPTLDLYDSSGALMASNDNWQATQEADIRATGYAPPNSNESVILTDLFPGNYTVIVRGVNNTTGIALVEAYKLDRFTDADQDGLDDNWELQYFGNLSQDALGDPDGDGVSNIDEFRRGLNPQSNLDSDSDGLPDDWETFWFGNLAQNGSTNVDNDALTNADEFAFGLNPKLDDGAVLAQAINYDALGKLTSGGASYNYDANGNILAANN